MTPLRLLTVFSLCFCVGMVLGCAGIRLSPAQVQAVVDAREGAAAAEELQPSDLTFGTAAHLDGALANVSDLPAPTTPRSALVSSTPARAVFASKGQKIRDNPPPGPGFLEWGAIGTGALALAGIGLKLGKNLPGLAGILGSIGTMAWEHFVPDKAKAEEKAILARLDTYESAYSDLKLLVAKTEIPDEVLRKVTDIHDDLHDRLLKIRDEA